MFTRGESIFNVNLLEIVAYIADLPKRGTYDDLFECGEIFDDVTDKIKLVRQQFKG